MKKIRLLLSILLIIVGVACNNKDLTKEFIPSDKLVNILVDMYINDGIMASTLSRKQYTIKDTISNYQYIFQKHQFSRHEFDSSIAVLTEHPDEYAELYEEVIARLTQIEGNLNDTLKAHNQKKIN